MKVIGIMPNSRWGDRRKNRSLKKLISKVRRVKTEVFTLRKDHQDPNNKYPRKYQEVNMMRCYRCGGLMIYETFYGDCEHFLGWKCISCGEIVDRVILENRRSHHR